MGCAAGCGPADIFFAPAPYGVSFLLVGAPLLGLAPGDDVTALTFQPCLGFTALDADGDTIDDGRDNCLLVPNPSQTDVDVDGYGNQCDADYTNAGVVGIPAFNVLSAAWGSLIGAANYNPNVDHDESGSIGIPDFIVFSIQFGGVPGPSGLPCAGTVPCTH